MMIYHESPLKIKRECELSRVSNRPRENLLRLVRLLLESPYSGDKGIMTATETSELKAALEAEL